MENWKAIPGYEGSYEVSDAGQVRSVPRYVRMGNGEGYLRQVPSAIRSLHLVAGYQRVTLKRDGKARSHLVHHLVLEAFVGPKPEGTECRHLNGQPDDNRLVNLKWGTSSENSYDVVRHGNHPNAGKTHCKRGHEFTPENTVMGKGGRRCRTCNKERSMAWYVANRKTGQIDNKDKTHCKRGHEFTPENTYQRKDGGRQCRTCTLEAGKARHAAKPKKGNANYDRTHCPQGHPYDEENTYRPPGKNSRMCKACLRQRSREYQRNKRRKQRE